MKEPTSACATEPIAVRCITCSAHGSAPDLLALEEVGWRLGEPQYVGRAAATAGEVWVCPTCVARLLRL